MLILITLSPGLIIPTLDLPQRLPFSRQKLRHLDMDPFPTYPNLRHLKRARRPYPASSTGSPLRL
jgi:hypothetical protein